MTQENTADRRGCLYGIMHLFGSKTKEPSTGPMYPFKRKSYFLSKAEVSFYQVLKSTLQEKAVICPKIRLSDILSTETRNVTYWNQISQKHIDFLLCRPDTMEPILAIELDDSSHTSAKAQKSDNFKNEAFKAAGLPLLRMSAKRGYNIEELRTAIKSAMTKPSIT